MIRQGKFIWCVMMLLCALPGVAIGAMCQTDFSVVVTMDKDTDNSVKYGAPQIDGMNWRVDVDYDTMSSMNGTFRFLRGVASCSEFSAGAQYTVVTGNQVVPADDTGAHCWCALRRPATSYFMYLRSYDSVDLCTAGCARMCADGVVGSYAFRDKLFEAVW